MSDSEDSDTAAVRRNRHQRPLFRNDERSSPVASSSPARATAAAAPRARARYLGDGGDGGDGEADDLFSDLDDIPNAAPAPRRLTSHANNAPAAPPAADEADVDNVFGGADGEDVDGVKQKKKRIVARMDDERLLGPNGFPRLLEDVNKFRTKGKGNEAKDLRRLMSTYQLWAHQMFPRTNLRDTLVTVERLCHKRRVHHALKGYRDEAKAAARKVINPTESDDENPPAPARAPALAGAVQAKGKGPATFSDDDFGMDADEEAALAELENGPAVPPRKIAHQYDDEDAEAMEAEREMEAEAAASRAAKRPAQRVVEYDDAFDEDEAAIMAEFENSGPALRKPPPRQQHPAEDDFDEEAAEMMAELDDHPSKPPPPPPAPAPAPAPITINGGDDEFGDFTFDPDDVAMLDDLDLEASISATLPSASATARPLPLPLPLPLPAPVQEDEDEFGDMDLDDEALALLDVAAPTVVSSTNPTTRAQDQEMPSVERVGLKIEQPTCAIKAWIPVLEEALEEGSRLSADPFADEDAMLAELELAAYGTVVGGPLESAVASVEVEPGASVGEVVAPGPVPSDSVA